MVMRSVWLRIISQQRSKYLLADEPREQHRNNHYQQRHPISVHPFALSDQLQIFFIVKSLSQRPCIVLQLVGS
jgi:hypothetical protein